MTYGSEVHRALEDYVREGKPLVRNYQMYKTVMDAVLEIPGERFCEHKMALDVDRQPCQYGKGYWVRGIVDLMTIDESDAYIVDYKTGSNKYPDTKQLKLMALMAFAHFPEVENIKAGLLFVAHNSFVDEEYKRDDIDKLWKSFEGDLQRLDDSYKNNVWNPSSTPLCGWCPVNTCEYYKVRR
jgi:hypothetical protein